MSGIKWIGATLGWTLGGPIGAIIGLAIGSLGDAFVNNKDNPLLGENAENNPRSRPQYKRQQQSTTQSGDFEVSLLILASVVIKADNHTDQRELDYVRQQFINMYGKERANQAFKLFKNINKQKISTRQVAQQIRYMMDHPSRLQLVHFLFGIAKADGVVSESEERKIRSISNYLGINPYDYNSIKAMFYNTKDNAYEILEISPSASIDEIKKAYRKMAKKYHPDRVEHLGKEHKKGAEEKFKEVLKAYEQLQKEHGF